MAVLLVGGTSGTGKTTLAKHLSTRLNAQVVDVDLHRASLVPHATRENMPGLHEKIELGEAILDLPTANQLDLKLMMAREICRALEDRIRDQLTRNAKLIIEGDDVLPELTDRFPSTLLRAVIILPRSELEVARRETIRNPPSSLSDPDRRQSRTRVTWSYAEWLRGEATRRDVPVLDAAPSGALIARAERALGLDGR
jgi:2-phosphoglycerate kinase